MWMQLSTFKTFQGDKQVNTFQDSVFTYFKQEQKCECNYRVSSPFLWLSMMSSVSCDLLVRSQALFRSCSDHVVFYRSPRILQDLLWNGKRESEMDEMYKVRCRDNNLELTLPVSVVNQKPKNIIRVIKWLNGASMIVEIWRCERRRKFAAIIRCGLVEWK